MSKEIKARVHKMALYRSENYKGWVVDLVIDSKHVTTYGPFIGTKSLTRWEEAMKFAYSMVCIERDGQVYAAR